MEGLLGPAIKKRDGIDRGRRKIAPDNPEKFSCKGTELTRRFCLGRRGGLEQVSVKGLKLKFVVYGRFDIAKIFLKAISVAENASHFAEQLF
ncbi:hypothetical protein CEXT_166601 [Caerostris extrusa]|uniref:Uncharacterized protein n=1 Tax=Caerostris extrusa TaxID=172846 RepID=A0AAV4T2A9_CAEEX|nr:hypothetical protein CEXT_166601 [Caerostris extrusa]